MEKPRSEERGRRRPWSISDSRDSDNERRRDRRSEEKATSKRSGGHDGRQDVGPGRIVEREPRLERMETRAKEIFEDRERNRDSYSTRRREGDNEEPDRKRRRSRTPADDYKMKRQDDRQRRRSRTPADDYERRRQNDRNSKRRSRENRSPRARSSREKDSRPLRNDETRQVAVKRNGPLPSQETSFSLNKDSSMALVPADDKPLSEKQKPNFAPTGLLAAETNTVAKSDGTSIVLKYHEPPEARKPSSRDQWKLFVFKGAVIVDTIELSLRSCWLIGREIAVVDMAAEHPSISKQHAVIQFRYIEKRNDYGDKIGKVRPFLIDLDSANGTKLNKDEIPASRYLELRDKDMIQFGDSTREYVLMLPPKDESTSAVA